MPREKGSGREDVRVLGPQALARVERRTDVMLAAMHLGALREARGFTYAEHLDLIAARRTSAEPGGLLAESPVRALREAVEALGGELRVTARFPDADYPIDLLAPGAPADEIDWSDALCEEEVG